MDLNMSNYYSIKQILVKISDPWELGAYLEWKALQATIIAEGKTAILIKLSSPFIFKGITCEFLVASPRLEGTNICELQNGVSVFCGMTRISEQQASSENPLDLSTWRGGLAIIGELEPVPKRIE
jgi:hypothetical protein